MRDGDEITVSQRIALQELEGDTSVNALLATHSKAPAHKLTAQKASTKEIVSTLNTSPMLDTI